MKNLLRHLAIIFIVLCSSTVFGQTGASIEGMWLGSIEFNGMKLRIVLKVSKTAEGFAAKFDSIDQGATDLEIDTIKQQNNLVSFEAKKYGLSYEGTLSENGNEISGTFKQGAGATPLTFKRTAEMSKLNRPQ